MTINRTDVKQETLFLIISSLIADLATLVTKILNGVHVHGGFAVGTTTTKFKTSASTAYIIDGQNYNKAATDDIAQPAAGITSAGQYRKDLISIDATGTVTVTAGTVSTVSQNAAVKPAVPAGGIELGWIEVPPSFTPGTTVVTTGMLKQVHSAITLASVVGS